MTDMIARALAGQPLDPLSDEAIFANMAQWLPPGVMTRLSAKVQLDGPPPEPVNRQFGGVQGALAARAAPAPTYQIPAGDDGSTIPVRGLTPGEPQPAVSPVMQYVNGIRKDLANASPYELATGALQFFGSGDISPLPMTGNGVHAAMLPSEPGTGGLVLRALRQATQGGRTRNDIEDAAINAARTWDQNAAARGLPPGARAAERIEKVKDLPAETQARLVKSQEIAAGRQLENHYADQPAHAIQTREGGRFGPKDPVLDALRERGLARKDE